MASTKNSEPRYKGSEHIKRGTDYLKKSFIGATARVWTENCTYFKLILNDVPILVHEQRTKMSTVLKFNTIKVYYCLKGALLD